jgi:hypothetical protein
VKQVAVTIDDVPNAVLAADASLQQLLTGQMQAELNRAVDDHLLAQIASAGPLGGSVGADLIAQVRAAVGVLRAAGFKPSVLALSPDDSASLDLTTTGADDAYVFSLDVGGSRLWALNVIEVASGIDPHVLDPAVLGTIYSQSATLTVDSYTGLAENTSRLRLEANVLAHVRDPFACYVVS